MPGSKGLANFIQKCKLCERTGNIDFIESSLKPYKDQNGDFQTIASFECRGIELIEFFPGSGFVALTETSEQEVGGADSDAPIELVDGDWAGYDEEADQVLGIYEFKSQFVAGSKK